MYKKIIKLKKTERPDKLVLLEDKKIDLKPFVKQLEKCGWFITKYVKTTQVPPVIILTEQIDYTLRDEGVKRGCFLLNTEESTCGICRRLYNTT